MTVPLIVDCGVRIGLNSVKMYYSLDANPRASTMPTNLGGFMGSYLSPTWQAIGGITNDGLSIVFTGGMTNALSKLCCKSKFYERNDSFAFPNKHLV